MKSHGGSSLFNAAPEILVVDDDRHILEVIEARLVASGFTVIKATSSTEALSLIDHHQIDLMVCDVKIPDMSGFELFKQVRVNHGTLPVIFLTAFGTIPDAVRAMKAGAIEYLTKPFDGRELVQKIRDVLTAIPPRQANTAAERQPMHMGKSPAIKELYDMVRRVSIVDVNVLILGESGTGKEYIAHMIHNLSHRAAKPFMTVDCGSTPPSLLESELFGHMKGSFTHAIHDKKGLVEAAHEGTLFLDEIGNIAPEMQMRLLRFLEERKIRPIGSLKEIPVDCRVIAATNANLVEAIREGSFREDLYYRLRVVTITIPPLRRRREDISELARFLVDNFCRQKELPRVKILSDTTKKLLEYTWPGNVRELRNTLEAAVALSPTGSLRPEDIRVPEADELLTAGEPAEQSFSKEGERQTIIRALKETGGVQKAAAKLLGISRRAIHYKIKKYGIDPARLR